MQANRRLSSLVRLPAALVAVAISMVAFMIPSVVSAQYTTITLLLSASTVPPSAAVTFTVNGCEVGAAVTMTVDNTSIAVTVTCVAAPAAASFRRLPETPAPGGTATGTVNAPTTPGTYTARVTTVVSGVEQTATAVLTVTGAATTTTVPGGALPSTGSDVGRIATGAAAVIGIGFGAVLVSRRRRLPTAA